MALGLAETCSHTNPNPAAYRAQLQRPVLSRASEPFPKTPPNITPIHRRRTHGRWRDLLIGPSVEQNQRVSEGWRDRGSWIRSIAGHNRRDHPPKLTGTARPQHASAGLQSARGSGFDSTPFGELAGFDQSRLRAGPS